MKLRNRKTWEVWDIPKMRHPTIQEDDISFFAMQGTDGTLFSYGSLADLNAEWEDYNPAEPLIEDKDIRNAVRAFGEVYKGEPLRFNRWGRSFEIYDVSGNIGASICFNTTELGLTNGKEYTIAELCGEEEE